MVENCVLKNLLISSKYIKSLCNKHCTGFAGADYIFTHGEIFIIWILMAILVNNCLKK